MTTRPEPKRMAAALIAGVAVILISAGLFNLSLLISLVLGAIVYLVVSRMGAAAGGASAAPAPAPMAQAPAPAPVAEPEPEPVAEATPEPAPEPTPEPTPDPVAAAPAVRAGTILPGQAELAARKGSWRYEG